MYEEAEIPVAKMRPQSTVMKPVAKAQPGSSRPSAPVEPPPAVMNLQRVVAGPGSSPFEPLCIVVDKVGPATLSGFTSWQLTQLDVMVAGGPLYQCYDINNRPSFKQESRTNDPTGGLMLWWHNHEQEHAGWYLSAQTFYELPKKDEKVLQSIKWSNFSYI